MENKTFAIAIAIAIDGPVASGKGTISPMLAHQLHGFYLSTGAMYRALALFCVENGISVDDADAIVTALSKIEIIFKNSSVFLNGTDISEKIKEQEVANAASVIAIFPEVRQQLVLKQQAIATSVMLDGKIVVSEGRDTGTKVFPDSPLKIYLTASKEARAARRFEQYKDLGQEIAQEDVLEQIVDRDRRDMERVADPLPKNPESLGYFIVDSSTLSEEQTLEAILKELERRGLVGKG